jgi:hypothetical protein
MRVLAAILALTLAFDAAAQESPEQAQASPSAPSSPSEPAPPPPAPSPAPRVEVMAPPPPPRLMLPATQHPAPSPDQISRWRTARVLSVFGSILSIAGTALSLSSVIYVAVTNYPPSPGDLLSPQAKPSDPGPILAYVGSSASAAGFVLSASGLGLEHHILDQLGADPGRGRFAVGTSFGVLGFISVGAGYFFGLTNYLDPHDQSVALLTTTIGGAALCAIASVLYASDSTRLQKAWSALTTF